MQVRQILFIEMGISANGVIPPSERSIQVPTIGAYFIFQSGQPWQRTSYEPYVTVLQSIGSTNTSDTNRNAEPAGSRVTSSHWQLDLNYTQTFWKRQAMKLEGMVDVYNLFNRQTGYNPTTSVHSSLMGSPQSYFLPRRVQLGVKFLF